jgi:hypothetical protein
MTISQQSSLDMAPVLKWYKNWAMCYCLKWDVRFSSTGQFKFSIIFRPQWKNFFYNTKWWILIHWYPTDTMYLRYTLTSYWHNDMLFIHTDLDLGYESWRGRWASPMRRGLCWGPPSRRRSVGDTLGMWRAQTAHAQNLNKSGKFMALAEAALKFVTFV